MTDFKGCLGNLEKLLGEVNIFPEKSTYKNSYNKDSESQYSGLGM